jgi:hypothetical protein
MTPHGSRSIAFDISYFQAHKKYDIRNERMKKPIPCSEGSKVYLKAPHLHLNLNLDSGLVK